VAHLPCESRLTQRRQLPVRVGVEIAAVQIGPIGMLHAELVLRQLRPQLVSTTSIAAQSLVLDFLEVRDSVLLSLLLRLLPARRARHEAFAGLTHDELLVNAEDVTAVEALNVAHVVAIEICRSDGGGNHLRRKDKKKEKDSAHSDCERVQLAATLCSGSPAAEVNEPARPPLHCHLLLPLSLVLSLVLSHVPAWHATPLDAAAAGLPHAHAPPPNRRRPWRTRQGSA